MNLWGPGPDFYRFWMDFGAHGTVLGDPGTILGRSWDIRDYKIGHCEVQAWILLIFSWFRGPIERDFWVHLERKHEFFTFISRLLVLMISGSESGCLGSENQAFGKEGIAKINFCRNWISHVSRVNFSWFWVALGPIFMTCVALENGLEFDDFSEWFWGHPRSCDHSRLRVICLSPGPK